MSAAQFISQWRPPASREGNRPEQPLRKKTKKKQVDAVKAGKRKKKKKDPEPALGLSRNVNPPESSADVFRLPSS